MTATPPSPDLPLAGMTAGADGRIRYPVADWHPPHCGHSGMAIDAEGRWFHEGRAIARPEMVALFARLLRREADGRHVLVTPVEMLDIEVADAPLIAVEMASAGEGRARCLAFRIGATGDWIAADATHRLMVAQGEHGPRPYLTLDVGLRARLARPVYYALAELADDDEAPGVWSQGVRFSLEERV